MEQKGTFSITVEAGYQLKFRQTVDELLRPINTNPDYSNVRNYITNIDSDTGITNPNVIRNHLCMMKTMDSGIPASITMNRSLNTMQMGL